MYRNGSSAAPTGILITAVLVIVISIAVYANKHPQRDNLNETEVRLCSMYDSQLESLAGIKSNRPLKRYEEQQRQYAAQYLLKNNCE